MKADNTLSWPLHHCLRNIINFYITCTVAGKNNTNVNLALHIICKDWSAASQCFFSSVYIKFYSFQWSIFIFSYLIRTHWNCTTIHRTGLYFCDTGSRDRFQLIFYPDDPLWDGVGCGPTSTCCSFNNPPWFCKQLPQPTTDNIELRLCRWHQS